LPADYQAVADWLKSEGLAIVREDPHHMALFVRGKVRQIAQSLKVNFARVTSEGKEYTSAVTAPGVPAHVSSLLVGINGLQPHIRAHKHLLKQQARPNASGGGASYTPSQIAHAYDATGLYGTNITGGGQTIAIVIDTFPAKSDLISFWQTHGINQSINNISFIQVISGTLATDSDSISETTLDTEWSSSIAPGAKVRVYAVLDLASADLDQAYEQVYTDVTTQPQLGIHQMSMSYGQGEKYSTNSQVQTDDQYFAELAAVGVTCFASSGDGGASPGDSDNPGDETGPVQAETPASDPNVTGVGGTTLKLDSNNNETSEVAWNNSSGAGGGGASIYFSRPVWQTGASVPAGTMRDVPDVACSADPDYGAEVYLGGVQTTLGGTSWAGPTWAGFCALINQARANAGLPSLGGLNSQIYPILSTTHYSTNFRDITSGNNFTGNSPTEYSAGTGYDQVTGIGVPLIQALSQTLVGTSTLPQVQISVAFQDIVPGQNATITATSTGSPVGYQWQRMPIGTGTWSNLSDNGTYSGSATASLTISGATTAMSGDQFQCVLTYAGPGSATSPSSSLVVDTPLIISTLAGEVGTTGLENGSGTGATFAYPSGIALDSSGNLYIADYNNNEIREVMAGGVVSTPFGSLTGASGSANNTSTTSGNTALFNTPNGIAADSSNNLYVADTGNNLIRKIVSGVVSTLAGSGGQFSGPEGVAVDASGNVYVADTGNDTIDEISPAGSVGIIAGQTKTAGYADGAATTKALFNAPSSVAVDGSGNVYVADFGNSVVRKISAGVVSTIAGQAGVPGYLDGPGGAALFNAPSGVAIDGADNLYVTDCLVPPIGSIAAGNDLLRKVTPAGVVSTLAGQAGIEGAANGTGTAAQFYSLQAVALNLTTGAVYLADTYNQTIRMGVPLPPPTISVAATQAKALVFGPTPGQFTVTRTGGAPGSQTLNYSLTGTAGNGTDYVLLPGTVTIPAGASSAAITVTPIEDNQATSSLTVQLTLGAALGYTVGSPSTATVTIQELTPYQTWATNEFGANAAVAGIADATATPENDGVPNLLKYLTDIDPSQSMSATDRAALPTLGVDTTTTPGTQYLTLTYRQYASETGLAINVQTSPDLQTWTTVSPPNLSQQVGTDSTTGDPIMEMGVIMPPNTTRKFIRLNVSMP
jgi:kumamolisin